MATGKPVARPWRLPSFEQFQLIGLLIGVAWIGPRTYAAFTSTSIGLISDAVQHIIEVAFSLFVYLSLRAANRSSALLFPHGTGKFEAIANSLLAISLVLSGAGIFGAGVMRVLEPAAPEKTGLGIVLLAAALCINALIYVTSKPLEKEHGPIVKIWRGAYLLDLFMKSTTIAFVFVAESGGIFVYLDPLAAIAIGVSMLLLAVKALKDSVWELSDRALEEEVQLMILKGLADNFHSFDELIDVRTRRTGGKPVIEVVVGFYDNRSWRYVTQRAAQLHRDIEAKVAGAEVMVIPRASTHYVPFHDETVRMT